MMMMIMMYHVTIAASEAMVTMMILAMMMMSGTECSTLTFSNCNNCSDVNVATEKAECYSCDPGYALKDDNSTCTST